MEPRRLTEPAQMIDRLLTVPYARDRGDWAGADCWGIVELWYRHVLGIKLSERRDHPSSHEGLQAGFDLKKDWQPIDEPADHALVVMRAGRLIGEFRPGQAPIEAIEAAVHA